MSILIVVNTLICWYSQFERYKDHNQNSRKLHALDEELEPTSEESDQYINAEHTIKFFNPKNKKTKEVELFRYEILFTMTVEGSINKTTQ